MTHKYLFVCMRNVFRSKYAANWARTYFSNNDIVAEAKSAGLQVVHQFGTQLEKELADWADTVLVMEEPMVDEVHLGYSVDPRKIVSLGIPDIFDPHIEQSRPQPPYDDNCRVEEAPSVLAAGFKQHGMHGRISLSFFYKVLEAKLNHVFKENASKAPS